MKYRHISDTHFGHTNIIKYCDRPFNDSNEMDEYMINAWNEVVEDDDIVIHYGDFMFGGGADKESQTERAKHVLSRLKGKKVIITGNHDRKNRMWFLNVGFDEVIKSKVQVGNIILSHRPESDLDDDYVNIHGHIHNNTEVGAMYPAPKYINVGVEIINYRPILLPEYDFYLDRIFGYLNEDEDNEKDED